MKTRSVIAAVAFSGLALALLGPAAQAGTASVAVAANFTAAAKRIEKAFEAATGNDVVLSFGSTGRLYAQILHGAPFDAFLAADMARPKKLEKGGQGVSGTRFSYALGQLVLWSRTDGKDVKTMLESGRFNKLAIANPKTAPYGAAALQVLDRMALRQRVADKLVQGDNIAQTRQFVFSGAADLGFVARAQIALDASGSRWPVPDAFYAPIVQQAILLARGKDNAAAQAFLGYLHGPEALKIIHAYGYRIEE